MKKANLVDLISILKGEEVAEERKTEILKDLEEEQAKGAVKSEATRQAYAELKTKVFDVLKREGREMTANDLAVETGASINKIAYGFSRMWGAEVVINDTVSPKTYRLPE